MTTQRNPLRDTGESQAKAALRVAVTEMEGALARLSSATSMEDNARLEAVRTSWRDVVEILGLGPVPEIRQCPRCGATAMKAATRCSNCWSSLTPVEDAALGR
jgi:hypothetical protein